MVTAIALQRLGDVVKEQHIHPSPLSLLFTNTDLASLISKEYFDLEEV